MPASEQPAHLEVSTNEVTAHDVPASSDVATDAGMTVDAVNAADPSGAVIALAARTDAVATTAIARPADGLVTVRPKPEKRKNAKERAKEKITGDRTTPMTAKAKSRVNKKTASDVGDNASDKAAERASDKAEKAALKARKAETKAAKISAAKAAKAARAA